MVSSLAEKITALAQPDHNAALQTCFCIADVKQCALTCCRRCVNWVCIYPSQCCHDTWCGLRAGASSGLHHDFHDNLYVLLHGRKRFRLYSPDHAKRMYTHGRIAKVHANGRIVYADQASGRSVAMRNGQSAAVQPAEANALPGACSACKRPITLMLVWR